MFRLDGKIGVVIGGAGGLGEACALALARQGAKVIVASRNLGNLEEVAKKIKSESGSEAGAMQVDVENEESLEKLAEQIVKKYERVDILVNAQGINTKMPPLEIDRDKWDSLFDINVRGVVLSCKVFGKIMVEQKEGKIINLSSVRGIRATDGGNVAYGATKGAVDMITRMLAAEWIQYNITVNAIGPSLVLTELVKKSVPPERLKVLIEKSPSKKLAVPEDVAAACVYLASDEAGFVTGQILYVDGGLTAVG
jgi:gluconate 5-dehydrogenase